MDDDAKQSALAASLIHRAIDEDIPLFVSDIVICEVVWVLSISYHVGREEIAALLRGVLHARHLRFAATDQLDRALQAFERGNGDFADYLIREHARHAGYTPVVTFDKALLREADFAPVS